MSRKKSGVRLYGFEEYIERLQELSDSGVDESAEKCFNECAKVVDEELHKHMNKQDVPQSIQNKVKRFKVHSGNTFMFSEGWNKTDEETFKKVCYLNYGTPKRTTSAGENRGKVKPRYFISNAKRAAAQRMKKIQKDALKEMSGGGS